MLNIKPQSNKRQQETGNEAYTSSKEYALTEVISEIHMVRLSRQGNRQRRRPGAFLQWSTSEVCLGSWAKTGLVNLETKRNVVLVVSCRVLSKWCIMRRPGRWGRLLITRAIGKVI